MFSIINHLKAKLHGKIFSTNAASMAYPKALDQTASSIASEKADKKMDITEKGSFEPIKFSKLVSVKVETCPHCQYFVNTKTMHKYITINGPIFLKKELAKESLKPFIKISEILKCSRCGYEKTKKKMYIPVETADLLEPLLSNDVVEIIDKVKNVSLNIEKILTRFLG